MDMHTEPARVVGRVVGLGAGVSISLGTFFTMWGNGVDWRIAVGAALAGFAIPAGASVAGAEVIRSRVYSPASADELIAAEDVIEAIAARPIH